MAALRITDKQSLILLTLVAIKRSVPTDAAAFSYLRKRPHEDPRVQIIHPGLKGQLEVSMSDLRALAKEGFIQIEHEDSIFGMIDLTPAGVRAADAQGE